MSGLILLIALAAVCVVWVALSMTSPVTDEATPRLRDPRLRITAGLLWLIGLAPIAIGLVGTPATELEGTLQNQSSGAAGAVGEIANGVTFVVCVVLLSWGLMSRARRNWSPVAVGAVVFFFATAAAAFFGTQPAFYRGVLLVPLAVLTFLVIPMGDLEWFMPRVKRILLMYVYSALVLAVVWPAKVLLTGYASVFGLPAVRLIGLVFQGNILGPIAAFSFFVVLRSPRTSLRWVHLGASGLVLFLAQGKAAWIATVIGLLFVWAYGPATTSGRKLRLAGISLVLLFVMVQATSPATQQRLESYSTTGQDFETLNGRTFVWDETLKVWQDNPWFGYGPTLWSEQFRAQYGQAFAFAGQAHNQFIQSLGESGLVGLAGLIVYVLAMLYAAVKSAPRTGGLTMALFSLLAIRLVTEAALRTYRIDASFMFHILLTYTLMVGWHDSQEALEPAGGREPDRAEPAVVAA
ncbi:MAG TPA: O-antigen ligase family protein [Actinomycetota bacterium]|nr:O-antigen ligase family protein [Actinomycetota bacterium]